MVKIIATESLPTESENPGGCGAAARGAVGGSGAEALAEDGVCGSEPPALAHVDGRLVVVGTPFTVAELAGGLARGHRPPGVSDAQIRLVEAWAERST